MVCDHYTWCGKHQIFPAISLKKTRLTQKSAKHRATWEAHKKAPFYKKALAMRYNVEAKVGEAKTQHGLRTTRDLGRRKCLVQSVMTFLAMHLKRILPLVRGPARSLRAAA